MASRRAIDRADIVAAAIAIAESNGPNPLTERHWERLRAEGFGWWTRLTEKHAEAAIRSYIDRHPALKRRRGH